MDDYRNYYGGGWPDVTIGGLRGNAQAARVRGLHSFANYLERLADIKECIPRIQPVRLVGFKPVRFEPVTRKQMAAAAARRSADAVRRP